MNGGYAYSRGVKDPTSRDQSQVSYWCAACNMRWSWLLILHVACIACVRWVAVVQGQSGMFIACGVNIRLALHDGSWTRLDQAQTLALHARSSVQSCVMCMFCGAGASAWGWIWHTHCKQHVWLVQGACCMGCLHQTTTTDWSCHVGLVGGSNPISRLTLNTSSGP